MKKLIGITMVGAVMLGATGVLAGGACCASKAKTTAASQGAGKSCSTADQCANLLSKLNLSEEQKTKLADLKAECDKADNSAASWENYCKGLHAILTPEQLDQCKSICKENGWQCPLNKSDVEKTSAQSTEAGS